MKKVLTRNNNWVKCEYELPKKSEKGEFNYVLRIHERGKRVIKIRTTNDMKRRMYEHLGYYEKNITVCWISPRYSKYTTLRVEDRTRQELIDMGLQFIRNDRFVVPKELKSIDVKVRKIYHIPIDI